jgi:predicted dithiol-disulfide oxidoreductase (DUF899 family)
MSLHRVVSRDHWLAEFKALLAKGKEMTWQLDALRAERRKLPWASAMCSTARTAGKTLADLFGSRRQP